MYNIKRRVRKFDTDDSSDMAEYEDILNNPLCSIIESTKEKLKTKEFADGEAVSEEDELIMVIVWEEKVLA